MRTKVWYPYQQMQKQEQFPIVQEAHGCTLHLENGTQLVDAVSSWWCVIHGYNHPEINNAIKDQLDKVSHVMMGGISNAPAEALADKLIEITPDGLNHVFFSDSGSVGVEVALKMAIQYHHNKGKDKKHFIALNKAYHGDTFKTMEVGDDPCYHGAFKHLFDSRTYIKPPYGWPSDQITQSIDQLKNQITEHKDQIAGFIVEPLLQGAGGFRIYDPEFLNQAYQLCKEADILMIFDEVATGFGRTGKLFAAEHCNFTPDIMILSKALTAGYIGHAATLATDTVFESFYGKSDANALMHGPTFSGNPLACATALKSIEIFERDQYLDRITEIETKINKAFDTINHPNIKAKRVLGACGAIEVFEDVQLKGFQNFAMERGVWMRPFEEYVYLMPPYLISDEELEKVLGVLKEWFG